MKIYFCNQEIEKLICSYPFSCIYKILNTITGDFYIGSSNNFYHRHSSHTSILRRNTHHSTYLQNAYNKYGKDALVFNIEELCNERDLEEREQWYLDTYKPVYNTCKNSKSCRGVRLSEEHKRKVSVALKGRKKSKEHAEKSRAALIGRKWKKGHCVKKVLQYDLKGDFVMEYTAAYVAKGETGITAREIRRSCRGDTISAGGYIWLYKSKKRKGSIERRVKAKKEEYKNTGDRLRFSIGTKMRVVDKRDGNELSFLSIRDLSKHLSVAHRSIKKKILGIDSKNLTMYHIEEVI